jgi:hypothetical protein
MFHTAHVLVHGMYNHYSYTYDLGLIGSGSYFHSFKEAEADHLGPSGAELKIACTTSCFQCGA